MKPTVKYLWIGLHVVLTGLLFWFIVQDFQAKGQLDPKAVGKTGLLLLASFAIVAFILALVHKGAGLLFPALRSGQQSVRNQRER